MRYAIVFTIFAIWLITVAIRFQGVWWLLLWPAISFLFVGLAYLRQTHSIFGKRPDGKFAPWAIVIFLPFFLFTWTVWHVRRWLSKEVCSHEIVPGVWLGRRAFHREIPGNVTLVVDMTAEFLRPAKVMTGKTYWCIPTLDNTAIDQRSLEELIAKLSAWPGDMYIHCALGRGRSATVVAALLIARSHARDVPDAIRLMKSVRPWIYVNHRQRAGLEQWHQAFQAKAAKAPSPTGGTKGGEHPLAG